MVSSQPMRVFIIFFTLFSLSLLLSTCNGQFNYVIQIQDKTTNDKLKNVQVCVELEETTPICEITDTNGYAVFEIPNTYEGRRSKLTIDDNGRDIHNQSITLSSGSLPETIKVETNQNVAPTAIPTETPTFTQDQFEIPTQENTLTPTYTHTPIPSPSPPIITATPLPLPLIFYDTFVDNSNGWTCPTTKANLLCSFDGVYRIFGQLRDKGADTRPVPGILIQDFCLTFDGLLLESPIPQNPENTFARLTVLFRYSDSQNYYSLEISPYTNKYKILKKVNDARNDLFGDPLQDGNQVSIDTLNSIKLSVEDNTFELIVNGYPILSFEDNSLLYSGQIRFGVTVTNAPTTSVNVDIQFDNVSIWNVPCNQVQE